MCSEDKNCLNIKTAPTWKLRKRRNSEKTRAHIGAQWRKKEEQKG